ncbi:ankyrin repeat, SAM and basic leucine zipper domain-containing protein 1-like [Ctenocephalides felis]|uniref:ankyrin repeat, SAM and basic leucine zipper domain-containing protein 1-like n=1 Tax=Ctenocephalides felis TaxID=7515 RepID=UPI000E6E4FC5|nr:ankyrin repeat, SAM and basic leucine zipper domain-containing protein 1-like [Ctenocephalides felis]
MIAAAGMSDDEESDEGFSFGSSLPRQHSYYEPPPVDPHTTLINELYAAVKDGDLCAIQKSLNNDLGVTLETPLQGNWTAMMHACSDVNIPVVKFLIQKGVSVNSHIALFTPLMAACSTTNNTEENVLALVKLLIENGANINFTDAHGVTALMLASQVGYVSVVEELLTHKIKVNQADNQGHNALFWAINENHYQVCSLLIEKNCDVNAEDIRGTTCYQLASSKGLVEIMDLLDSCAGGRKPNPYWVEARNLIENVGWKNLVPGVKWCGAEEPPYYADLDAILTGMELEHHVPDIIHKRISLSEFLLLNEQKLKELKFLLPYERRIIMQNLKLFHIKPWLKNSIMRPIPGEDFDIFNFLIQITAHYKHIALINVSLKALNENSKFEKGTYESNKLQVAKAIEKCQASLMDLKRQLKIVQDVLSKVTAATEEPVLFISSDTKVHKPKRNWFKYTIYTFLPLVAVYSIKKVIKKL